MMNLDGARVFDSMKKYRDTKSEEFDETQADGWNQSRPAPPRSTTTGSNSTDEFTEETSDKPAPRASKEDGREVWKFYKDSPYEVSSHGRVRRGVRILKPRPNPAGYEYANMSYNGKAEQPGYHEMVAELFLKKPNGLKHPVVKHKNGKKSDNRVSNLEWGDVKDNTQEGYDEGHYRNRGNANPKKHAALKNTNEPDYVKNPTKDK